MKLRLATWILTMACLVGSSHGQTVAVDDLIWQWVHPRPQGNVLNAVANNGDRYVAVGDGGVAVYSDGLGVFQLGKTETTQNLSGVVWDGQQFVAIGGSRGGSGTQASVFVSPNGEQWQRTDTGINVQVVDGFAFSGSVYVTTTSSRLVFGSSPTSLSFGDALGFSATDVDWTGTEFVVVGNGGGVASSPDGETVVPIDTGFDDNYAAVASNGDTWVAVALQSVVTTTDAGDTWSETLFDTGATAVVWDGQQFIVFISNGVYHTSPDGVSWTEQPSMPVPNATRSVRDAVLGDSGYFAAGGGGAVYSSPDAITWSDRLGIDYSATLASVAWSGQRFVAAATDQSGLFLTSTNGRTWDLDTPLSAMGTFDVHWDGAQFLAVGRDGQGGFSADGLSWTDFDTGTGEDLYAVTQGGGLYVAVGNNGVIVTSPNLTDWQEQVSPTTDRLQAVIWTGERYVAAGRNNALLSSEDGTTWVARTSPVSGSIEMLVTNGSVHLTGNDFNGVVGYSTNGVDWTPVDTGGPSGTALAGLWNGGEFVLMSGSSLLLSGDGQTWRRTSSVGSTNGRAIAGAGETYVIVGAGSTILRSAPQVIFADGFEN